jgi:hypothetical protein
VLGNHDYWSDRAGVVGVLEEAGIRHIVGGPVPIDLGPWGQIELFGSEAPWGPGFAHSPPAEHTTRLVLSHTPDNVRRYDWALVDQEITKAATTGSPKSHG